MIRKILVPLDGSQTAEAILPYARHFAAGLKLPIELLEVVDIVEVLRSISAAEALLAERLAKDDIRRSGEYLEAIAGNFSGVPVTTTVKQGQVAEIIIETAVREKDTLIALASHGRSGVNRFLLGSVAEKILRGSKNPLLLVRAGNRPGSDGDAALKSMIVPLDGSELAETVLPMAHDLAQKLQIGVILFRAYAVPYGAYSSGEGFYDPLHLEAFHRRLQEEARDYLERKTAELKGKGLADVSYVLAEGPSADEIIKFARVTPNNLIAMSSHGYSGVKRWVLGSVTEIVARHSGDPLLVLRQSG
jgi:nucleotide-binding universal stress UspA family protein